MSPGEAQDGHPAVPSRCLGGLFLPGRPESKHNTYTEPLEVEHGGTLHFGGGQKPQPRRQQPGRSPLSSAWPHPAGAGPCSRPGSGTEPGLVSAISARRGGVRGGAGAGRATKPSAQQAGDQEAQQRRAAAGRAAGGPQLSPRCPPAPGAPRGWEPNPAVPCPALPCPAGGRGGCGACGGRREGGRAAAKPLRAGAGMSLPGGAAAGCALRRGG